MAAAKQYLTSPPPPSNPPILPLPAADLIIPLNYPTTTKLNHSNFLTWKSQIQPIVHGINLTRFLDKPPPERTIHTANGQVIDNPVFSAWDRQDQLLLGWIRSSLIETVQAQVSSCTTSRDLWNSLKQTFFAIFKPQQRGPLPVLISA